MDVMRTGVSALGCPAGKEALTSPDNADKLLALTQL